MPRKSPYRIELTDEERAVLESLARSYTLPYWQVMRAQMVLMAADGLRNDQIAIRLRCGRDVVSQWRKRFFEQRLAGLEDRPRRGRPPAFPPQVRAEVIRLACERPADNLVPLARWSSSELAREAVARGICEQISGVTVWRWLSEDAIKPWQHRSRIFPPDLEFTEKAGRILDLYSRRWEGELLHPGDYVVSCDEKPSIQPRRRKATPRSLPRLVSCAGSTSSTNTNAKARSATSPLGTRGAPSYSIARHQGRDRPVRCARRAVHEDRALQQGPAG